MTDCSHLRPQRKKQR